MKKNVLFSTVTLLLTGIFISFSAIAMSGGSGKAPETPEEDKADAAKVNAAIEKKIDKLIKKMSVEEKVGQMTQVNLNVILEGGYSNMKGTIDTAKLRKAVVKYKVGSILNTINHAYPLERWHTIITKIQDYAKKTPNDIPVLYGIDAIHGTNYTQESTLFPHNVGLAASRNIDLVKKSSRITAKETRASGIRWNFDPVLDVGRNPVWPRFEETYGEDVYITKKMGAAAIKAYEGDDLSDPTSVASCMKHFIGYSNPRTGKDRTPAHIPERFLREIYLPPFKEAVKAGASTVMLNSGEVNGVPVHGSKQLLQGVLRDELNFDGLAVSDWEDVIRLHTRHKVASTPKEAVKMAVKAGVDMSMVPHDFSFFKHLTDLVKEGEISEKRINKSVRRILRVKYKTGLFDNPYPEEEAKENFGKPEYEKTALKAAQESITLLKNNKVNGEEILPLSKDEKVLVAGPGADNIPTLHGSWSYAWQGTKAEYYPEDTKTILDAFKEAVGSENILSVKEEGWLPEEKSYKTGELKEQAKNADKIVLCLGENAYAESPGVIDNLTLPENQLELARVAAATGKPVVLVLTEGRPRVINEIVPEMEGIIQAYRPGSEGGPAIADVVFGDYNPSGKLPYTYPQYPNDLVLYDHKFASEVQELSPGKITYNGYKPQWPFGHGLSYTTFAYKNLTLEKDTLSGNNSLKVEVSVTNNGERSGKEAVELYYRDLYASVTPRQKELCRFKKIQLDAGETKNVKFTVNKNDLDFINRQMKWVTGEGKFELMVGGLKKEFAFVK